MHDVVGIAQTLVDVCIDVPEEFITKHGLNKGQFNMVDRATFENIHGELDKGACKIVPGGAVSNTLAGLKLLGANVGEFAKVGDDEHGAFLIEDKDKNSIGNYLSKHELPTGCALTLITGDAQRTFAVYLGAAPELTEDDIDKEVIKSAKIIFMTGYEFESPKVRKAVEKAVNVAKQNNVLVAFDIADPGVVQRNLTDLKPFVEENVDILFANEEEAEEFTGLPAEQAVEALAKVVDYAVVKIGEKGSYIKVANKGNTFKIDAEKIDAKDTTGAGDIYASGILFGIVKELPMEIAGKVASFAAAKVVEQVGARLTELDVSEFLDQAV